MCKNQVLLKEVLQSWEQVQILIIDMEARVSTNPQQVVNRICTTFMDRTSLRDTNLLQHVTTDDEFEPINNYNLNVFKTNVPPLHVKYNT